MQSSDDENDGADYILKGHYANHFRIGHNAFEFIIDFGQFYEGNKRAQFSFRAITSPAYALELRNMLSDSLHEYEESFGRVVDLT